MSFYKDWYENTVQKAQKRIGKDGKEMSYYSTAKLLMYRDDFVKMVEKLRADGNLKLARLDTNSHLDLELYRQNGDGDEMVVA